MTKRYEIEYLEIANSDLGEIFDYIMRDNPNSATILLDEIDASISNLADFPELGIQPKDGKLKALGYRILIVSKYLVFYIIRENVIEVHRILHGSRNYNYLVWKEYTEEDI